MCNEQVESRRILTQNVDIEVQADMDLASMNVAERLIVAQKRLKDAVVRLHEIDALH